MTSVQQQIELIDEQLAAMKLTAQRRGRLFAPQNRKHGAASPEDLTQWAGTPLSGENVGAWFEANTVFGVIGDPQQMEAVVVVHQADVELLKPGQDVVVHCLQFANDFLHSELSAVSQDEMLQVPTGLSQTHGGPVAVKPTANGEQPVLKSYTAFASFDSTEVQEKNVELLPGMRGQVRILVGQSSLGSRLYRYLSSVIRFR